MPPQCSQPSLDVGLGFQSEFLEDLGAILVRAEYSFLESFKAADCSKDFQRLGHWPFSIKQIMSHFPGMVRASVEQSRVIEAAVDPVKALYDDNGEATGLGTLGGTSKDLGEKIF